MNHHCLLAIISALLVTSCAHTSTPSMTKGEQSSMTPDAALQRLEQGNARFVSGKPAARDLRQQIRKTAEGQHPFASVVCCIDSRTSAELVFDQGLGDVFTARVAGNIINEDILGSLEFASKVAGSKLIAVVGHTACGAVKGACDHVRMGNLTHLLKKIEPSVAATPSPSNHDRTSKNAAFVDRVAYTNVQSAVREIRRLSPLLREMENDGKIKIVGGMQDLRTGKVNFFDS